MQVMEPLGAELGKPSQCGYNLIMMHGCWPATWPPEPLTWALVAEFRNHFSVYALVVVSLAWTWVRAKWVRCKGL